MNSGNPTPAINTTDPAPVTSSGDLPATNGGDKPTTNGGDQPTTNSGDPATNGGDLNPAGGMANGGGLASAASTANSVDPGPVSARDGGMMNGQAPNGGDLAGGDLTLVVSPTNSGDPAPVASTTQASTTNSVDLAPAVSTTNGGDPALAESSGDPTPATAPGGTSETQENQSHEDAPRDNNWATRNPTWDVIPARSRPKRKLTKAQLASRKLAAESKSASRALLMQDVDKYLEALDVKVKEIADEHNVKPEFVKKLINPVTTYKKTRAPTLPNAIAHFKAMEVNESEFLTLKHSTYLLITNTRFTNG